MNDDRKLVEEMRYKGYRPADYKSGFSADEVQAYRNGLALYPGRAHPPLMFGFDIVPASRVPEWCHRDTLPSLTITDKDGQQRVVYRVPTNPTAEVVKLHKEKSAAAFAKLEYVRVHSRTADPAQHWSDMERATEEER